MCGPLSGHGQTALLPRRGIGRWPSAAPLFVGADGERITRGTLQYRVLRAFRRAGIDADRARGALVHGLRHTFATETRQRRRQRLHADETPGRMQLRSVSAVTIGSDAANPDAAIPVARSSHDLAAKTGDLGGMLRMTTDTSCGRGRLDFNRRVLAATA
jgi:hypothetical protein